MYYSYTIICLSLGVKFEIIRESRLCDPALGELDNPSCKSGEKCWKPFRKDYGFCEEGKNLKQVVSGNEKIVSM